MRCPSPIPATILILLLTLGMAAGLAAAPPEAFPGANRPNIILVLADDLDLLLGTLNTNAKMKTLLADRGATFSHFFVPLSLCCPSRSNILTGRYPHNTGVWTNNPPGGGWELFNSNGQENATVAVALKNSGYRTALMGKYLNGYPDPADRKFIPPGWSEWYSPAAGNPYNDYNYAMNENGVLVSYGSAPADYMTDVLAGKAVDFISRMAQPPLAGTPFFIYIAPYVPHTPATPAPRHVGMFPDAAAPRYPSFNELNVTDKPAYIKAKSRLTADQAKSIDQEFELRLESMQGVDDLVELLVGTLQTFGMLENTWIFFTSDNGYHMGEHRMLAGKYTPYQEDIRVPLIVRGPGVPEGALMPHLAGSVDLAPTFADLAGLAQPEAGVDGRSLRPLLTAIPSAPTTWRHVFYLEQGKPDTTNSAPDFSELFGLSGDSLFRGVLEPPDPMDLLQADPIPAYAGFQTYSYKYVKYESGETELYDLAGDPFELANRGLAAGTQTLGALSAYLEGLRPLAGQAFRDAESQDPPQPSGVTNYAVKPADADPAVTGWTDSHVVCIDKTAPARNMLFVFLPGSFGKPENTELVVKQAATAGLHAIGLRYPNSWTVDDLCASDADPDCHEKVRLEILDGADRSPLVTVGRADCVETRLGRLLQYLADQHPTEGWGNYLENGAPRWGSIVVAGHSQGGGHAALLGKVHPLARVVMFSAPADYSAFFARPAPWVAKASATPADRWFGFAHREESGWARITGNWALMGLDAFGSAAAADTLWPPFGGSHILATAMAPAQDGEFHGSTAVDRNTPLDASELPFFARVWGFLAAPAPTDQDGNSLLNGADSARLAAQLAGLDTLPLSRGLSDLNADGRVDAADLVLLVKTLN